MTLKITLLFVGVFLAGSGYIMYAERPVMKMEAEDNKPIVDLTESNTQSDSTESQTTTEGQGSKETAQGNSFTLSAVSEHAKKEDCWAAINGNVYDLTDWVSRHPGGERAIVQLCGTDATEKFTKKHGSAERPANMLALFRIGALANES